MLKKSFVWKKNIFDWVKNTISLPERILCTTTASFMHQSMSCRQTKSWWVYPVFKVLHGSGPLAKVNTHVISKKWRAPPTFVSSPLNSLPLAPAASQMDKRPGCCSSGTIFKGTKVRTPHFKKNSFLMSLIAWADPQKEKYLSRMF